MRTPRLACAAVVSVALLGLTACGTDSETSPPSSSSSSTSASATPTPSSPAAARGGEAAGGAPGGTAEGGQAAGGAEQGGDAAEGDFCTTLQTELTSGDLLGGVAGAGNVGEGTDQLRSALSRLTDAVGPTAPPELAGDIDAVRAFADGGSTDLAAVSTSISNLYSYVQSNCS